MLKVSPLFNEQAAQEGANLEVIITHEELTETTAATAQVIPLFKVDALYQQVECIRAELQEPFEDTADAANNTTAASVGDGGSVARLLASTEFNRNGTEVYIIAGTGTKYVFGAADTVDLAVSAPAATKTLAALNKGRLRLLFRLFDSRE